MVKAVINIENVSKQYRLGEVGTGTFKHDLNKWWHEIRGKQNPYKLIGEENERTSKGNSEYIWALKNINFKVNEGEALGIIGRNGAGKSTLLKLLSRTTTPTTGKIKIKGRLASLLEVGTGFHPELSGRDNIYLNGAILGMRKFEIDKKFDEIVDFSGVERYLDTPVKRYSSGMYVRLAFAVAAHLEPDILIVDEVLAVGDADFQAKCIGKMRDVSETLGRTILFVSHNLTTVQALCNRSILMHNGYIKADGNTQQIINQYLKKSTLETRVNLEIDGVFNLLSNASKVYSDRWGLRNARTYCNGLLSTSIYSGAHFKIEIDFEESKPKSNYVLGFAIKDPERRVILAVNNKHLGSKLFNVPTNKGTFLIDLPNFPIYGEGRYTVDLFLGDTTSDYDIILNALFFDLQLTDVYLSGNLLNKELNSFYPKDIKIQNI